MLFAGKIETVDTTLHFELIYQYGNYSFYWANYKGVGLYETYNKDQIKRIVDGLNELIRYTNKVKIKAIKII